MFSDGLPVMSNAFLWGFQLSVKGGEIGGKVNREITSRAGNLLLS